MGKKLRKREKYFFNFNKSLKIGQKAKIGQNKMLEGLYYLGNIFYIRVGRNKIIFFVI